MADDTSETGDESTTPGAEPETGKDWKAEAEKWQALARKNEKQAKSNADAAARIKELEPLAAKAKQLEDAGKSEIERLTEQIANAQRSTLEAEARALRFEVAAEHKLTPAQAKWLQGVNREELEANVADLLEAFKPAEPDKKDEPPEEPEPTRPDNSRRRPQERLRPGAVPDAGTEPVETNPRKLAAMVPRPLLG